MQENPGGSVDLLVLTYTSFLVPVRFLIGDIIVPFRGVLIRESSAFSTHK